MKALMTLLTISVLYGALVTDAFAEVYKRTNPDGSVTFSDVPPKIDSKPIELPPASSYTPPATHTAPIKPKVEKKVDVGYESISITSPANDTAVRDNAGNLTVKFNAKPELKPDHSYVLLMDGENVGESKAGNIQLKNVDRGSHTLIAQIIDKDKEMIIQSEPVVVHLQRAIAR